MSFDTKGGGGGGGGGLGLGLGLTYHSIQGTEGMFITDQ